MIVDKRLKTVSPLWFKRISEAKSLKGLLRKKDVDEPHRLFSQQKTLDITKYGCCMVGEAYEFDDIYTISTSELRCKKCISIAQRVVYPIKAHWRDDSIKYFQRVIREFCNHLEREHGVTL